MQADLIQKMQKQWRRHVKSVKRIRKALFVDTFQGPIFVKGYDSLQKVEWVVFLTEKLREKGFKRTLQYVYTKDQLPYIPHEGRYYVATKPIPGRDAQYDTFHDIVLTVSCLAEFHYHAQQIKGGPVYPEASVPILDKWEDRLQRFQTIIERMKRSRSLGTLEKRIIKISPYIIQEAQSALDFTKRSPIEQEYRQSLIDHCVAHRDLASHNFRIGDQTYLIDYDTAMYDNQLLDLVQMMNRTLDQQAWNLDIFATMIEQYQRWKPLNDQQLSLAYLLLRYPDNFMREVIGLYGGRPALVSKKIDAYLTMIMKNWSHRMTFFQGSRHFFREEADSDSSIVV
ncbi:phosphotransferase [Ammoniphilus resinae]|uniref:CotS family spore coat protein n=1 Tax=Ammoniphilus resinae TaxID=861532 RepID=A0ABS4GK02_9BACL|nr:phosphotransferase [Ammoniphilus resinae]MBP1930427.1 CotS family spore coat protein [Ammoniphilus resinae]